LSFICKYFHFRIRLERRKTYWEMQSRDINQTKGNRLYIYMKMTFSILHMYKGLIFCQSLFFLSLALD